MFIDLHCHTKNAKSSETKREVSSQKFLSVLRNFNVGIVAITNHNLFDLVQYNQFSKLDDNIHVWPGIELDVDGEKSTLKTHGHIILISNPRYVNDFNEKIGAVLKGKKPDDFSIKVTDLVRLLNELHECLIICHYMKKPQLSTEDIEYIKTSISDNQIVLLEPSNSRKAALLYYDDNEQSWFGSDVKDWDHYPNDKVGFCLPECRFSIKSFDQFYFLLKKNRGEVLNKGYLDPKRADLIPITLFGDLNFQYQVFNDVNIIFGGKATAKTSILKEVESYYKSKSKNVVSYYIEYKADDLKILVNKEMPSELTKKMFETYASKDEISFFKKWQWSELPSLSTFYKSEKSKADNAINNRLRISKAKFNSLVTDELFKSSRKQFNKNKKIIDDFRNISFKEYLTAEEYKLFSNLINKIIEGEKEKYYSIAADYFSLKLEKWTIEKIKAKLSVQTSTVNKPSSVGLTLFYTDYKKLKKSLDKLKKNMGFQIEQKPYHKIGEIPFKGNVYSKIMIGFNTQKQSANYKKIGGERKYLNSGTQSEFAEIKKLIDLIKIKDKTDIISKSVIELKNKLNELKIDSLIRFLNYTTYLVTDKNNDYDPSNGITSILLVEAALQNESASVIILDEPDAGMGADFINSELLKRINQRAREGKIIFIATHDANLVVRTHPYSCLYREEMSDENYLTYYGSSFDDNLVNINNPQQTKTWIEAVVDKCEGGDDALNERNRTYGKY